MYLIVGLGNPGREYAETRHNIGFRVIYELASKHKITVTGLKNKALIGQGIINGKKVILAEPQTYMNLSGEAVAALMNYFKIELEDMIVIYDDLDLEPGKLRMRGSGGPGGHNGIKSMIDCLGTRDFSRVRVGIGRPEGQIPVRDFVLSKFFPDEKTQIEEAIKRACAGVELWLDLGLDKAMNKVNRDPEEEAKKQQKPKPESKTEAKPDVRPDMKLDMKLDMTLDAKPDVKLATDVKPETDNKTEKDAEPEKDVHTDTKLDTNADTNAEQN